MTLQFTYTPQEYIRLDDEVRALVEAMDVTTDTANALYNTISEIDVMTATTGRGLDIRFYDKKEPKTHALIVEVISNKDPDVTRLWLLYLHMGARLYGGNPVHTIMQWRIAAEGAIYRARMGDKL